MADAPPPAPGPAGAAPAGGSYASNPLAKYKLVFLGDQAVGKTSIITRNVSSHSSLLRYLVHPAHPRACRFYV